MLSMLYVRLTIKVKVGIPETFKVGWYPHKITGSSHLKPLLKQSTSPEEFKNFRPISNLRFTSKIIDKCVSTQLIKYLNANCLGEVFQSAYREFHSTKTALIRVFNNTAIAIDNQESVILLLLDLSATFDILSRLSKRFGINGSVLQ